MHKPNLPPPRQEMCFQGCLFVCLFGCQQDFAATRNLHLTPLYSSVKRESVSLMFCFCVPGCTVGATRGEHGGFSHQTHILPPGAQQSEALSHCAADQRLSDTPHMTNHI